MAQQDLIVMVVPSDLWCERNGAVSSIIIDGKKTTYVDYIKAFSAEIPINESALPLPDAISVVTNVFQQKDVEGFEFKDITDLIKQSNTDAAFAQSLTPEQTKGQSVLVTPNDKLIGKSNPDVRLDMDYKRISSGMGGSYYQVTLTVKNPFTGEPIATAVEKSDVQGNGIPLDMIKAAIGKVAFKVIEIIRKYKTDIQENGEKIQAEIAVLRREGSDFSLKTVCESANARFNLPIGRLVQGYMESKAVKRNVASTRGSGVTNLYFPFIRKAVYFEEEDIFTGDKVTSRYTPNKFAVELATFLSDNCSNCRANQQDKGLVSFVTISPAE